MRCIKYDMLLPFDKTLKPKPRSILGTPRFLSNQAIWQAIYHSQLYLVSGASMATDPLPSPQSLSLPNLLLFQYSLFWSTIKNQTGIARSSFQITQILRDAMICHSGTHTSANNVTWSNIIKDHIVIEACNSGDPTPFGIKAGHTDHRGIFNKAESYTCIYVVSQPTPSQYSLITVSQSLSQSKFESMFNPFHVFVLHV